MRLTYGGSGPASTCLVGSARIKEEIEETEAYWVRDIFAQGFMFWTSHSHMFSQGLQGLEGAVVLNIIALDIYRYIFCGHHEKGEILQAGGHHPPFLL